ncbi:flagellar hook capping FlgD N-terminal domain-containing protein [Paenibacillus sp. NPDC058071]|uniref:flagellar hook capping FlgD N-terminal domain-containing protein n=1 Tax=Paenibacillus sp. NPDC058071 TaxID=3346326 RepID=UPI0036DF0797
MNEVATAGVSSRLRWPDYDTANKPQKTAEENQQLDKDDFFKILITQLQNQDPTQPLQDREFIAQMAQFTSVEQMMNVSKQLTLLRQNLGSASSMIGKEVQWNEMNDKGEAVIQSAVVQGIVIKNGEQYAKFGDDTMVLIDHLISISEPGEKPSDSSGSGGEAE